MVCSRLRNPHKARLLRPSVPPKRHGQLPNERNPAHNRQPQTCGAEIVKHERSPRKHALTSLSVVGQRQVREMANHGASLRVKDFSLSTTAHPEAHPAAQLQPFAQMNIAIQPAALGK